MKRCPKCGSVTREEAECPICGESLAYEEYVDAKREKIKLGRHYLLYLFRSCFFSLVCIAVAVIINIVKAPCVDISFFVVYGIALLSLFASAFKRTFVLWNMWTCNDKFAEFSVSFFIIVCGLLSVIFAFVLW